MFRNRVLSTLNAAHRVPAKLPSLGPMAASGIVLAGLARD